MTFEAILSQLILLLIVLASGFYFMLWPGLKKRRITAKPFPADWLRILKRRLPFFSTLPGEQQQQLLNLIKQFIHDKKFIGCSGQPINDEVRVTVAAQACLLLLNRSTALYPGLQSILVYPTTFIVTRDASDDLGLVSNSHDALTGESWSQGKVVLAWDSVDLGVRNLHDGENVVLHEFAHQLDQESGIGNGAPVLGSKGAYATWARVLNKEFETLQHQRDHNIPSLLDYYGATDPAEFFAVATEAFFEQPQELARRHAALYAELKAYYCVDPLTWHSVE